MLVVLMKFSYKKVGKTILRPIISVDVSFKHLAISYEVLVDSGADFCIFHNDIADVLEIDLEKGRKDTITGVTGVKQEVSIHPVTLVIGGWKYETEAAFCELGNLAHGVVGQKGFFEFFAVKFDYQKEEIEITQKPKK